MSRIFDVIRKKRDGGSLEESEIRAFIEGVTSGEVPDYQVAALLMAVFFRGLSPHELALWTDAMLHSGEVLDLSEIQGVKVDKHSTGGVGDKVSIALAPLVAAAGVPVPMISGRGLGHTGGTLDKLEAIPGFRVDLGVEKFISQVRTVGTSMIGQTAEVAPADRKLYALRDVTATVASIPLIAASIMSKKLAAGIDGLVLDVKVGRGAFMKELPEARKLAETLVGIGERAGKSVWALISAMDQPLGLAIGNGLETIEAIEVLHGGGPQDLVEVTLELGARMLVLGGKTQDVIEGKTKLEQLIESGAALDTFRKMVEAQGGDPRVADDPSVFPQAPLKLSVNAERSGYVNGMDAEALGLAGMGLGAGREKAEDNVDPSVGILLRKKVGVKVEAGEELALLLGNSEEALQRVAPRVVDAYDIKTSNLSPQPLIIDEICPRGHSLGRNEQPDE